MKEPFVRHRHRLRHTPRVLAFTVLLALCSALAACGNKGPLVHPDPAPAPAASTTNR